MKQTEKCCGREFDYKYKLALNGLLKKLRMIYHGSNNFYLKENDPQVEKLTRGRLIAVNQN